MSDYGTYILVQSAISKAESLGWKVTWDSEGWCATSTTAKRTIRGSTVNELHHYLNGYEDGVATQRNQKERRAKPTVRAKKYG